MQFIFSLLQIHDRSGHREHMKKSQVGWLLCGKTWPGTFQTPNQRWTGHLQHRVDLFETGRLDDWTWCVGCQQLGITSASFFWAFVSVVTFGRTQTRSEMDAQKTANRFKIRNEIFGAVTSHSSETRWAWRHRQQRGGSGGISPVSLAVCQGFTA